MKSFTVMLSTLTLALLLLGQPVLAGGGKQDPVKQMAEILMDLNHGPSQAEKTSLQAIANNDAYPATIRDIALAMSQLNHRASPEDKARLRQIMNDSSSSSVVRELARIVAELNHKPSRADKQALQQILDTPSMSWAAN